MNSLRLLSCTLALCTLTTAFIRANVIPPSKKSIPVCGGSACKLPSRATALLAATKQTAVVKAKP